MLAFRAAITKPGLQRWRYSTSLARISTLSSPPAEAAPHSKQAGEQHPHLHPIPERSRDVSELMDDVPSVMGDESVRLAGHNRWQSGGTDDWCAERRRDAAGNC